MCALGGRLLGPEIRTVPNMDSFPQRAAARVAGSPEEGHSGCPRITSTVPHSGPLCDLRQVAQTLWVQVSSSGSWVEGSYLMAACEYCREGG